MASLFQPNAVGWKMMQVTFSLMVLLIILTGCALPATTVPRLTHTLQLSNEIHCMAFSPDGTLLATGYETGMIDIWDVNSATLVKTLEGHKEIVNQVAFSPDGKLLVSGSLDKTTKIWQISDGKLQQRLEGNEDVVSSVAFSPDGAAVATGSWDGKVKVWQVSNGKLLTTFDHFPNQVNGVAYAKDGKSLASVAGMSLYLWQLPKSDKPLGKADSATGVMQNVTFSPDGTQIITISSDKKISTWQAADGKPINTIASPVTAYQADLNPQNTILAANLGAWVQFWRIGSDEALRPLVTGGNEASAFSADKKILATLIAKDKVLQIWEMPAFFVNE